MPCIRRAEPLPILGMGGPSAGSLAGRAADLAARSDWILCCMTAACFIPVQASFSLHPPHKLDPQNCASYSPFLLTAAMPSLSLFFPRDFFLISTRLSGSCLCRHERRKAIRTLARLSGWVPSASEQAIAAVAWLPVSVVLLACVLVARLVLATLVVFLWARFVVSFFGIAQCLHCAA
jgi:hypothetical protein